MPITFWGMFEKYYAQCPAALQQMKQFQGVNEHDQCTNGGETFMPSEATMSEGLNVHSFFNTRTGAPLAVLPYAEVAVLHRDTYAQIANPNPDKPEKCYLYVQRNGQSSILNSNELRASIGQIRVKVQDKGKWQVPDFRELWLGAHGATNTPKHFQIRNVELLTGFWDVRQPRKEGITQEETEEGLKRWVFHTIPLPAAHYMAESALYKDMDWGQIDQLPCLQGAYIKHINNTIRDKDMAQYFRYYHAHMIQHPTMLPETFMQLMSSHQGVGKNRLTDPICEVLGVAHFHESERTTQTLSKDGETEGRDKMYQVWNETDPEDVNQSRLKSLVSSRRTTVR